MLFLLSLCLRERLAYYPGCFYSQNRLLFLREVSVYSLSVEWLLSAVADALRCCRLPPGNETAMPLPSRPAALA